MINTSSTSHPSPINPFPHQSHKAPLLHPATNPYLNFPYTISLVSTSGTDIAAISRPSNNTNSTPLRQRRRRQRLDGRLARRARNRDHTTGTDLRTLRPNSRRHRGRRRAPLFSRQGRCGPRHDPSRVGTGRADVGAVSRARDDRDGAALSQGRRGQRRGGEVAAVGARGRDEGALADLGRHGHSRGDRRRGRAPLVAGECGGTRVQACRGAGRAEAAAWVVADADGGGARVLIDLCGRHGRVGCWAGWFTRRAG